MPDLTTRKPLYVIAALLALGLVVVIAGIRGGDMTGNAPEHDGGASQKADEKVAGHAAEEGETRNAPERSGDIRDDNIDKTPVGSVPHKALYKISMIKKHGGARISNVSGRMAFEWRPGCSGWLSRHRFSLGYEYPDSEGARVISRYTTLEAYDGSRMDFTSQRWRGGRKVSEYRGHAKRDADGGGHSVRYNVPEGASFDMPGDVMFPMQHTFAMLRAARNGETFFNRPVFDGHDDEGPVEISAVIGDTINAMAHIDPSKAIDTSLVNTKAWDVRMAFFPEIKKAASPDYELSAHLHDNSVISRMRVAYDEFTILQELVALEKLEVEACE